MGTQFIIEQIDSEISRLTQARALLENFGKTATKSPAKRVRRKMSPAARKRIADAQRARWAKVRANKK